MVGDGAAVSVIVPSYRGGSTLRACVDALLGQDLDQPFEVVVVRSGLGAAPTAVDGHPLPHDPRLRVLDRAERLPAAAARNLGVAACRGTALAFTDADAEPAPSWLRELLAASEGLRCCVAGAVANGTPLSAAGTAEYLVAFLDLHPRRPPRTAWHGATCNLLVPRTLWARHGPFPEDMGGGEDTVLTAALHRQGLLRFAPRAVVTHRNRTRPAAVVRHQHEYGRFTATVAERGPYKLRPLVRYRALAPLAGAVRLGSVLARTVAWARPSPLDALRAAPIVVAAVAAWTAGLARGDRDRRQAQGPVPGATVARRS